MRFATIQITAIFMIVALLGDAGQARSARSPEGSLSWVFHEAPLGDTDVKEILIDPRDDAVRYVTTGNGLYISWDAGELWEQVFDANIGAIGIDPGDPDVVYASAGSDLYRSSNQGLSWGLVFSFPAVIPGAPLDAPTFIDSILVSVGDGTIVVGLSTTLHSARIYVSEDGGDHFAISFESPHGLHFWDLAEIPSNGYWFFCTEDSAHTVDPVVMRSRDRGLTWEEMTTLTGVPTSGHGLNLAVHPSTEVVYFLSEATVLRYSTDFGDRWSTTYDGVGFGDSLLLDPFCPNRIFGGEMVRGVSVGGVFISEDSARSFGFEGLAGDTITAMALDNTSTRLFALAYGSGIWEASIGGLISCSQDVLLFADDFEWGGTGRWNLSVGGQ